LKYGGCSAIGGAASFLQGGARGSGLEHCCLIDPDRALILGGTSPLCAWHGKALAKGMGDNDRLFPVLK